MDSHLDDWQSQSPQSRRLAEAIERDYATVEEKRQRVY